MNKEQFAKVFPIGSHLCREPMPVMSELKKDMANLKRHGFNLIKLQEHWAIDEPVEGRCDFSRYEELIEHAASLDLAVYLGLTCEQAPAWLYRKHPGCRMVGMNGVTIAHEAQTTLFADGKPGPCFDHAGAKRDMVQFITQLVGNLGNYENLVIWNTWQEVDYSSVDLLGQPVCYCENTLSSFRIWLKETYDDLDSLNKTWNARYGDWIDISPDRVPGIPCACNLAFKYFMDNIQIARVLTARSEAIKAADPLKRPVFAHKGNPQYDSSQDWLHARAQDFFGVSVYPSWVIGHPWDDPGPDSSEPISRAHSAVGEMWEGVALRFDHARSCNVEGAPVWGAEFQGGPICAGPFHRGRDIGPEDIRRWMLTAVGSGATAIAFWVTRAEIMAAEANGFGLLDSEGDTTDRLGEASRIGRALNEHADLFGSASLVQPEVGILVNEQNYGVCSLSNFGGGNLAYSLRGWYRMLWELGVSLDFVDISRLSASEHQKYKALILPLPLAISEESARLLSDYVASGGSLISEACPGRIDQYGFCNRGDISPVLGDLFGVRHLSLRMVNEPENGTRWTYPAQNRVDYLSAEVLDGEGALQNCNTRANVWLETFDCTHSEPCLRSETGICGTFRAVGSGKAWLLGTVVGHSAAAYRENDATSKLVSEILVQSGVTTIKQGEVLIRKRANAGKQAWILTNPTLQQQTLSIDIANWSRATDLLGNKLEQTNSAALISLQPLEVRCVILTQ